MKNITQALYASNALNSKLRKLLKDANEILRSAYNIAERGGIGTEWSAFRNIVGAELEKQHKILHPKSK